MNDRLGEFDLDRVVGEMMLDCLKRPDRLAELLALRGVVNAEIQHRSEERRVGKECVSTCRSRWSPYHYKKKKKKKSVLMHYTNKHKKTHHSSKTQNISKQH